MATAVMMKNNNTDEVKTTYVGFSWTTLFFGSFPALFRLDFKYFLIQLVVHIALLCIFPLLDIAFSIAMAFLYNKLYTEDLLNKGFIFCDNPTLNEMAAVKVGCKPSGKNCDHLK